jgi:hypothetical protein
MASAFRPPQRRRLDTPRRTRLTPVQRQADAATEVESLKLSAFLEAFVVFFERGLPGLECEFLGDGAAVYYIDLNPPPCP